MGLYLLLSQSLSGKFNQKHFDHAKQSATDALKTSSKRIIQKTAESTGEMIGNKIANKTIKTPEKTQNNSETLIYKHDKEISNEIYIYIYIYIYISVKERQKNICRTL